MPGADDEEDEDYHERTVAIPLQPAQVTTSQEKAYLIVLVGTNVGEMHSVAGTMTIGRGSEAEVRVIGEAVSRRHARVVAKDDGVFIEDLGSTNGTFVNGAPVSFQALNDGDKIQIGTATILKFTYHDALEEDFQRELYDSALRDGLTKAFNKKHFQERLNSEFAYAVRHKTPLSLVLFDLDHFKKVNDNYGHLAGDYVLQQVGKVVGGTVRSEDIFARYGGEEFAILCRGIGAAAAKLCGNRIRHLIEHTQFRWESSLLLVTISAGVATVPHKDITTPQAFVATADQALYEAKRAGRNRVVAPNEAVP